LLDAMRSLG